MNKNYTPLLIVLLLVASYLLGMLTTKVQYLEANKKNPSVNQTGQTGQALGAAAAPQKVTVDNGHLPLNGDNNAKITIVEFSDFQCPYCKRFFDEAFKQIKDEYIKNGKVQLAFRQFPLPFHQNAQKAAEASECANEQNKFWDFHDLLFKNQDTWSGQSASDAATSFNSYAQQLGLDSTQFISCLESSKYKQKVADDVSAGQKAGVSGTPSFVINGQLVVGAQPYSSFKTVLDQELSK